MDDDGRLVLQIFPRHAPDRAITYSGDQQHFRAVMQDIVQRLVDGGGPPLELLDEDTEARGNGSAAQPVRIRELVNHLLHSDEDQFFSLAIKPGAADGRSFRRWGREWYIANVIYGIASGAQMAGILDENGHPASATRLAELRGERRGVGDPWDGRASADVTDLAEHLDDEDAEDGGDDD